MKKFLVIFLIALFAFQVSICQENEEENGLIPEEEFEEEVPEEEVGVEVSVEEEENEEENEVEVIVEEEDEAAPEEEDGGDDGEQDVEWSPLDAEEFLADEDNEKIYKFGAQFLIGDLQGNHQLSDFDWIPYELHSVYHYQDSDGYDRYKFNATIAIDVATANTFNAVYEVKASQNNDIIYEIVNYAATFEDNNYEDDEGNQITAWVVRRYYYFDESYTEQYLDYETFEPLTEETPREEQWTPVWDIDDGYGTNYTDWDDFSVNKAIKDKTADGTLEGDWSIVSIDAPYELDEYQGNTYYRFKFELHNDANSWDAYGEVFVYRRSSNKNIINYKSAIYSLNRPAEEARL